MVFSAVDHTGTVLGLSKLSFWAINESTTTVREPNEPVEAQGLHTESGFHIKPTPLSSLTLRAAYLPSSHPFSLQIQPTSLHVTLLRAVLRPFTGHFDYSFPPVSIPQFPPLLEWHILNQHWEKQQKNNYPLYLFASFSQSILFTFPVPFLCLSVRLLCSTYAPQQSRFPFLRL